MEDVRNAIRQGRALADERLYEYAMETWKAALSSAYTLQDFAGMFVLSGNIGEACVRIATQSKDRSKGFQLLQDAKANLDYALQIVEQCSLREVLGGYKALYQGVRRAEALRNKAERLLDELQREKMLQQVCTTCGGDQREMVLDENDGCFYCKTCYHEFYAALKTEDEDAGTNEDKSTIVDERERIGGVINDVWRSQNGDDEDNDGLVVAESNLMTVSVNRDEQIKENDDDEELICELDQETIEDVKHDRIRYERVELGSLADLLAGKRHVEDKGHIQIQLNDGVSTDPLKQIDSCIIPGGSLTGEIEGHFTATLNDTWSGCLEGCCESDTATADKGGAHVKVTLEMEEAEDIANITTSKREYSISQLLNLRESSPIDCPDTLLLSPVRDDGSNARNKPTNFRKKSTSKKISRSAASLKTYSKVPDTTPSTSPLPTLELCTAMRTALHEHQKSDNLIAGTTSDAFIDSTSAMLLADHVNLVEE
ncbi:Hypothetical protein PHPALM_3397 [Phytophthora palmivora]|uniref:Uncharacterized protein n=1 Tax=Phytophthora palmivora TaxID=4796 RepID=A0A2P4YMH5_9STRA|nr:Hypothetical protein PHPALM_3397 [Phytophthora palmivora]